MVLEMVSMENAEDYRGFLPDSFYRTELGLGIVCLDEEEEIPVGFTMLTLKEDSLQIEYIYVIEEYRRRGAGTLMLSGAGEMAEAAGINTLEIYFNALWGNEDIPEEFLLENGFLICAERELVEFASKDLIYSDYVKHIHFPKELDAYKCIPLGQLSKTQEVQLKRLLDKHHGSDFLPFSNRDMSFLCEKGGEEKGCILCGFDEDNSMITLMELTDFSDDPMCVAKLLITLGHYVVDNFQEETHARFLKAEELKVALAEKLLGDESKLKVAGSLLHGVKIIEAGE